MTIFSHLVSYRCTKCGGTVRGTLGVTLFDCPACGGQLMEIPKTPVLETKAPVITNEEQAESRESHEQRSLDESRRGPT